MNVSLRDTGENGRMAAAAGRARAIDRNAGWWRPAVNTAIAAVALMVLAWGVDAAIEDYHDRVALTGLNGRPTPIELIVAGEPMTIPGNMIRFRNERRGGAIDQVDLLLHWPSLEGFTDGRADAFRDAQPSAPLLFLSIRARENALDSTARLDALYSHFFAGPAVPGPMGLVGRPLTADSGYGGEILYFQAGAALPFVARCIADDTPEIPATCIRDVNVGEGLSLLYRFNRKYLGEWPAIDAGLTSLVEGFFRR